MKFVKPCPRVGRGIPPGNCKALSPDSRHTSCGHRQALQSPVPGFPAHILRTPANSAKPCPRIPGTHPCGHRQILQSPVPRIPGTHPADTGKLCKALSPGHGKAGRHDYGYSLQKKTAVKPPSRILFVFLITYGDSKPEGNSLSCKGTCKGW